MKKPSDKRMIEIIKEVGQMAIEVAIEDFECGEVAYDPIEQFRIALNKLEHEYMRAEQAHAKKVEQKAKRK